MTIRQFLTKKSNLFLLLLFIFWGLFFYTHSAQAFFGIPFDILATQLDALDFVDDLVTKIFLWLVLLTGEVAIFLLLSARLLDYSATLQVDLSSRNELVATGWNFTSGFANMVFVLIFIAIALSFIFNIDTIKMKKALPRLIAVALLVNFSLLFVKIFVDIGWIIQNYFRGIFGWSLTASVVGPLKNGLEDIAREYIILLVGYLTIAAIPFANYGRLVWWGYAIINEAFLGTFSQALVFIIFGLVSSIIFLFYSILFIARVIIIWLLAIAAPLAFVAFILPQTQSYFFKWFRYLLEWVFLGIVVFFLWGLGLKLFVVAFPGDQEWVTGLAAGSWSFTGTYFKYIFLLVYLAIMLMLSKKFVPAGINVVWAYGEMGIKRGSGWTAGMTGKWGKWTAAGIEKERGAAAERAEARIAAGQRPTLAQKMATGVWRRRPDEGERIKAVKELAEARVKILKEQELSRQRAQILARTPKDPAAKQAYINSELLKEGGKPSALRDKNKMDLLVEVAVKEGKISPTVAKFVGEAIQRKVVKEEDLYAKRPDLALTVARTIDPERIKELINEGIRTGLAQDMAEIKATEQIIREGMDKVTAEDFRRNVQRESLQNDAVILSLLKDEAKFREMERNARPELKREIIKTLETTQRPVAPEDMELLVKRANQISTNPRWQI